jgi:hypothetical protein
MSKTWSVMEKGSGIGAAIVARKALTTGWSKAARRKPPENPADPDVALAEALAGAVATGALIAVARTLAMRGAARYYVKSTGHLPPGLEKDGQ